MEDAERKFHAAVGVIQNLPKDGKFNILFPLRIRSDWCGISLRIWTGSGLDLDWIWTGSDLVDKYTVLRTRDPVPF
jgi:hypothetical protein